MQWANNQPFSVIPNLPEDTQHTLNDQDEIGWDNFFEGMSPLGTNANCLLHLVPLTQIRTLLDHSSDTKLWDIAWDLWDHRIGIIHAKENAAILHNMMAIDQDIRTHYHWGPHGLSSWDHQLFHTPLEDILSASILYQQKWLQHIETAWERAAR